MPELDRYVAETATDFERTFAENRGGPFDESPSEWLSLRAYRILVSEVKRKAQPRSRI